MVEAVLLRDLKELRLRVEFVVNTDGYKVSEMERKCIDSLSIFCFVMLAYHANETRSQRERRGIFASPPAKFIQVGLIFQGYEYSLT